MEKECKCCGNLFEPRDFRQIYCTDECRRIYTLNRMNEKYREERIKNGLPLSGDIIDTKCLYCGKEFQYTYVNSKKKFCCMSCYHRYKNMNSDRPKRASRKSRKIYDSMQHLTDAAVEARQLGLSYGQYIAYRDTGYLEHFKRMQFREKSEIRADGRTVHFDSTKMEDNF